jgi:hypothetical protein
MQRAENFTTSRMPIVRLKRGHRRLRGFSLETRVHSGCLTPNSHEAIIDLIVGPITKPTQFPKVQDLSGSVPTHKVAPSGQPRCSLN